LRSSWHTAPFDGLSWQPLTQLQSHREIGLSG
jgi:hypothetical protein